MNGLALQWSNVCGSTDARALVGTAIVWIKEYAPQEVHDHEFEKFLVVEGSCNIIVEDKIHTLIPGDYFAIPLHKKHLVEVTSIIPCKVILQRIAA